MARLYLTSYATRRFEAVRQELNASAGKFGISEHLSYTEKDLHASEYYLRNKSILDEVCGAGYWAWKPYFILRAMESLQEADILFYCDAGTLVVQSPEPLVEICMRQPNGLVVFDARPLINAQFTKRDCFVKLDCDKPEIWRAPKIIATILVIRKCGFAVQLLREWLIFCQDRAVVTDDPNSCGKPNLREFLQHRWDQAILSVLGAKYGIDTYRNPTKWGNYLKLPRFRVQGEEVTSPYGLDPKIEHYAAEPQGNSPYGTIFEINRLPNMVGKQPLPGHAYCASGNKGSSSIEGLRRWGQRLLGKIAQRLDRR